MTTNEILLGLGLTVVLAVGSQILARSLRIPALIVLLPVGFTAGALTYVVQPARLFGAAFSPLVSLAVALILYDAGLGLDLSRLTGHPRRIVRRLILIGVPLTWAFGAAGAALLLGLSGPAAVMLGAILVVSGPTVVGPLLRFARPTERLQRILVWEGSLVDPIGAILGAVVFSAVIAGTRERPIAQLVHFLVAIGVGLAGGAVGIGLLWLLLRRLRLERALGAAAQLAAVVGVAAACDVLRDDAGLIAAILMGLAVANLPGYDLPARRPFAETLIQLVLGLLFISISASVTPASLRHVVLPTLGLVVLLILLARPVVAAVATLRTDLRIGERGFVGWMAPRGIVAASTAATFSASLAAAGIEGAEKILPATFLVIVVTVTVYGLTAVPVARRLGVVRPARTRPLLVGDDPWVVGLGSALRAAGLDVLVWAGGEEQRRRAGEAGLEIAPGEAPAAATGRGAELEGVTAALLLTADDDFNALASTVLADGVDGPVWRIAPRAGGCAVIAAHTGGEQLFDPDLTREAMRGGATITCRGGAADLSPGEHLLFRVRADGRLAPVTHRQTPAAAAGDVAVVLGPVATPEPLTGSTVQA